MYHLIIQYYQITIQCMRTIRKSFATNDDICLKYKEGNKKRLTQNSSSKNSSRNKRELKQQLNLHYQTASIAVQQKSYKKPHSNSALNQIQNSNRSILNKQNIVPFTAFCGSLITDQSSKKKERKKSEMKRQLDKSCSSKKTKSKNDFFQSCDHSPKSNNMKVLINEQNEKYKQYGCQSDRPFYSQSFNSTIRIEPSINNSITAYPAFYCSPKSDQISIQKKQPILTNPRMLLQCQVSAKFNKRPQILNLTSLCFLMFGGKYGQQVMQAIFIYPENRIQKDVFIQRLYKYVIEGQIKGVTKQQVEVYFDQIAEVPNSMDIDIVTFGSLLDQYSLTKVSEVKSLFNWLDGSRIGFMTRKHVADQAWENLFDRANYLERNSIGYWQLFAVYKSEEYRAFIKWFLN